MNQIPKIDDTSHGWWRRIYILEFLKAFSEAEMDVHLTDKLKTELSGIFNWALDGYKRLRKNNYHLQQRDHRCRIPNSNIRIKATVSSHSYLIIWKRPMKTSRVMLKNTYELYESFCNSEGEKDILTKPEFKRILESSGYRIDNSSKHSNAVCISG